MNTSFVVAHCRKIRTPGGLAKVAEHNSRARIYDGSGALIGKAPDWVTRPERAHLNEGDILRSDIIIRRRLDRLKEVQEEAEAMGQKWRKPQKNAAAGVEVVISASPAWFDKKAPVKAYFEACRSYLERRFGGPNIIHWTTHYDEKTPHMHVLMVPIIKTEKGPRYSSSAFLGGREGLQNFQDEIAKVASKFGLQRGVKGSTARHTDQVGYIAKILKEQAAFVEEKTQILELGKVSVWETPETLRQKADELEKRENDLLEKLFEKEKLKNKKPDNSPKRGMRF